MKLFGGAISAEIPDLLVDASNLREVPDNQEVYVGTFQDFDISVIVELMEPVDKPSIIDALVYHVEETHRVSNTEAGDREQPMETLTMKLGKYEFAERIDYVHTEKGWVSLVFGLFRLPEFETEVLVTCALDPQLQCAGSQEVDSQKQVVRNLVRSFEVLDPKLFREAEESHEHGALQHAPKESFKE